MRDQSKMFPDFVPVEFEGVSIISAVVFVFLFTGLGIYYRWDIREHFRINQNINQQKDILNEKLEDTNEKVDILFSKVNETNRNLSSMNTNIAAISEAVTWIKKYMERPNK